MGHEQAKVSPTRQQLDRIIEFESQVYVSQAAHIFGGPLVEPGGPPAPRGESEIRGFRWNSDRP
jgi:hypothetical protein